MLQEDKNLLLKEVTARFPYELKCQYYDRPEIGVLKVVGVIMDYGSALIKFETPKDSNAKYPLEYYLSEIRPYLFPLSSMTKEQRKEFNSLTGSIEIEGFDISSKQDIDDFKYVDIEDMLVVIDWLNAHHFDYRGLIRKGLATDATGLNIY